MDKKRLKIIIISLVLATTIAVLVIASSIKKGMPHLTPDQLASIDEDDKGVRVDGYVLEDSIQYNPEKLKLAFIITDPERKAKVNVIYNSNVDIDDGRGVIVEGIYDKGKNLIIASKILTKCPSKYDAREEIKK